MQLFTFFIDIAGRGGAALSEEEGGRGGKCHRNQQTIKRWGLITNNQAPGDAIIMWASISFAEGLVLGWHFIFIH